MSLQSIDSILQLTPSELLFLNGDQFAKKAMFGNVKLLHCEGLVSASELVEKIFLTAFLAAEDSSGILLELHSEKAFLGLKRIKKPLVLPGETLEKWPESSLEASVCRMARELAPKKGNDVYNIVYQWLEEDSGTPWERALEKLQVGMATRGLLESRVDKKLKVFSVVQFSLPDSTKKLAEQCSVEPIHQLNDRWKQKNPELLGLLRKNITKAVRARMDQD